MIRLSTEFSDRGIFRSGFVVNNVEQVIGRTEPDIVYRPVQSDVVCRVVKGDAFGAFLPLGQTFVGIGDEVEAQRGDAGVNGLLGSVSVEFLFQETVHGGVKGKGRPRRWGDFVPPI
jgi:hypothetical protein